MLPAYFCAGYGFVVMATFIVAQIEREALAGYGQIAFLLVGNVSASHPVWDRIDRKYGDGFTLILALWSMRWQF